MADKRLQAGHFKSPTNVYNNVCTQKGKSDMCKYYANNKLSNIDLGNYSDNKQMYMYLFNLKGNFITCYIK